MLGKDLNYARSHCEAEPNYLQEWPSFSFNLRQTIYCAYHCISKYIQYQLKGSASNLDQPDILKAPRDVVSLSSPDAETQPGADV